MAWGNINCEEGGREGGRGEGELSNTVKSQLSGSVPYYVSVGRIDIEKGPQQRISFGGGRGGIQESVNQAERGAIVRRPRGGGGSKVKRSKGQATQDV